MASEAKSDALAARPSHHIGKVELVQSGNTELSRGTIAGTRVKSSYAKVDPDQRRIVDE